MYAGQDKLFALTGSNSYISPWCKIDIYSIGCQYSRDLILELALALRSLSRSIQDDMKHTIDFPY